MFVTLMYHSVDRRLQTPIAVTEEAFEAQLGHLVREGIPVLKLAEVLRIVAGETAAPERGVFLTLDDGYTDNLYAALPRLRTHGLEATLFVPTAHVGADNRWDIRARHRARHLDWAELERWLAGGGQIGGHTHAHEHAEEVEPVRLRESIAVNRRLLRERLGVEAVAFAYPYGIDTPAARAEVASLYRVAWVGSGGRGTWDPKRDPLRLNRLWVDPRWGAHELARELDSLFDELATAWTEPRPDARTRSTTAPWLPRPSRRRPRVALVVDRYEMPLAHPVVPRLLDLLEDGCDAHVVHTLGGSIERFGLDDVPEDVLRERFHPPPPRLQKRAPRSDLVDGLLAVARRRPLRVSLGLAHRAEPGVRYLRSVLLALAPDLVDLTSEAAARHCAPLLRALDARFVASGAGAAAWPRADAIYVEHAAELANARERHEGRPVAVIPPPIDPHLLAWESPEERRAARNGAGRGLRVLAVAPLVWEEGLEHLLDAVRRFAAGDPLRCRCRIVGAGPHESALFFARAELGLEPVVEIRRPGRRAAFLESLRWADVVVSAAVVAREPPWLRDAQAAGVPIVTTSLPESHGAEPVLAAPARDAEALADALRRIATDAALRRELGEAGRRRALSLVGVDDPLPRFRELYARALA